MIPKGNFEFGYFNRSYKIERATFQSISGNQGTIITKASKLGTYGKQDGFYSSLNINLGSLFDVGMAFQNLKGEQYNAEINDFEEASNQSFTAILKLAKPDLSKTLYPQLDKSPKDKIKVKKVFICVYLY